MSYSRATVPHYTHYTPHLAWCVCGAVLSRSAACLQPTHIRYTTDRPGQARRQEPARLPSECCTVRAGCPTLAGFLSPNPPIPPQCPTPTSLSYLILCPITTLCHDTRTTFHGMYILHPHILHPTLTCTSHTLMLHPTPSCTTPHAHVYIPHPHVLHPTLMYSMHILFHNQYTTHKYTTPHLHILA